MSDNWDPTFVALNAKTEPDWAAANRYAANLSLDELQRWIDEDSYAPVDRADEETLPVARAALVDLLEEFRDAAMHGHEHMVRFWIRNHNLFVFVVDDKNEFRWTVQSLDRSGALEAAGFE